MINVYIVTYRNPTDLNRNIASIFKSGADVKINIINNHSEFFLEPEYENEVNVLHNSLRPDFSTGHLARNWNQALIHGFRDLRNPASEIVVTVQDDVIFKNDWLDRLIEIHRRYSFVTMGAGDSFCSYLPEAVKNIGLWDERFCNIGFQEADYFLRALIYNGERSSINDLMHKRVHNAIEGNFVHSYALDKNEKTDRVVSELITVPYRSEDRYEAHLSSSKFHSISGTVFKHKWGISDINWGPEHFALLKPLIPNYMMYPYFEKDIEDLRGKNYLLPDEIWSKYDQFKFFTVT